MRLRVYRLINAQLTFVIIVSDNICALSHSPMNLPGPRTCYGGGPFVYWEAGKRERKENRHALQCCNGNLSGLFFDLAVNKSGAGCQDCTEPAQTDHEGSRSGQHDCFGDPAAACQQDSSIQGLAAVGNVACLLFQRAVMVMDGIQILSNVRECSGIMYWRVYLSLPVSVHRACRVLAGNR